MTDIVVISITTKGLQVAQRLQAHRAEWRFLHRPPDLKSCLQAHFRQGFIIVGICATGILIRCLSPLLRDKHHDPAVIALDETGQFAVPLISGHEGRANELSRYLADILGGTCVITGATKYDQALYVLGAGCIRGCAPQHFISLWEKNITPLLPLARFNSIATLDIKQHEPGLIAFAAHLHLPIVSYTAVQLSHYHERLSEKSAAVMAAVGCYGVAEAAALAQGEKIGAQNAELVIPKQKNAYATLAVARTYDVQEVLMSRSTGRCESDDDDRESLP